MFRNPEILENHLTFTCKKPLADYLQTKGIPLFGETSEYYYFMNNDKLKNILENIPLNVKIPEWISNRTIFRKGVE